MSALEGRIKQFQETAEKGLTGQTVRKDIPTLRKFLHKHQGDKFSEREKSHLFTSIQLYVAMFPDEQGEENPAFGLLEDALKMPFTVFATKQKSKFLKWYEKLAGEESVGMGQAQAQASADPPLTVFEVILDDHKVIAMDDSGETTEDSAFTHEQAQFVHDRLEAGESILAIVGTGGKFTLQTDDGNALFN